MRHIIDIENWERRENFKFFEKFLNPFYTVTSRVECSAAKDQAKERGESLFLYYLYALLRAVNEVDAFKYRVEGPNFEEIVFYDKVDILTPIVVEHGTFHTVRLEYKENFQEFMTVANEIIAKAKEGGDPYAAEAKINATGQFDVVLLAANPNLYYTSLTITQKHRHGSDYPMFNAGKIIKEQISCGDAGGDTNVKAFMPLVVAVHHGFVDGPHIARLIEKMEQFLREGF